MSDGTMVVKVWTGDGRRREVLIRVNDEGKVVIDPPPPGPILLDPVTDAAAFTEAIAHATRAAIDRLRQNPPS